MLGPCIVQKITQALVGPKLIWLIAGISNFGQHTSWCGVGNNQVVMHAHSTSCSQCQAKWCPSGGGNTAINASRLHDQA